VNVMGKSDIQQESEPNEDLDEEAEEMQDA
jgi:hypothetical protein